MNYMSVSRMCMSADRLQIRLSRVVFAGLGLLRKDLDFGVCVRSAEHSALDRVMSPSAAWRTAGRWYGSLGGARDCRGPELDVRHFGKPEECNGDRRGRRV